MIVVYFTSNEYVLTVFNSSSTHLTALTKAFQSFRCFTHMTVMRKAFFQGFRVFNGLPSMLHEKISEYLIVFTLEIEEKGI